MCPPAFADLCSLRFGHTHNNNFKKTLNGNLLTFSVHGAAQYPMVFHSFCFGGIII